MERAGEGGALSADLTICFKKPELHSHYHQLIENGVFMENPCNIAFAEIFFKAFLTFKKIVC
jgi:hypothetical protein